jgi:hypothetical protein
MASASARWYSGFTTRRAAEQARTKLLTSLGEGIYVSPTKITFGGFLTAKWLPAITATIRPTTAAMYRPNADAHIVPALGHVQLAKLTPDALNRFYGDALTSGCRDGKSGCPRVRCASST